MLAHTHEESATQVESISSHIESTRYSLCMKIRKDVDETAPPCGNSVVKTTYMYFTVAAQRPSTCGSSGTGDAGCAGGASSTGTVA